METTGASAGGCSSAVSRTVAAAAWLAVVAAALALFAGSLWFGGLNQDEGWYLYAARSVRHGDLPYRDFALTQGPVMPVVYAAADPLVGRLGVAGGRLFTAGLGLGAAVAAAWLASRLARRDGLAGRAAFLAFLLAAVNIHQAYFCTVVKTYALTGLLLTLGFVALTARARPGAALLSGVLMALAACTRTSAGFAVPVVLAGLIGERCRGRRGAAWLWFGLGAAGTGALVFAPFLVLAPQAVWFAMVEYHSGRQVGGGLAWWAYRFGFVARVTGAYFVALTLALGAAVWRLPRTPGSSIPLEIFRSLFRPAAPSGDAMGAMVAWSVAAISAVHLLAPFPYDDYQAFVFPLFAAGLAPWVLRTVESARAGASRRLLVCVTALSLLAAGSSPVLWQWFAAPRDRIWWPLRTETPLAVLQRAAALVRERAGGDPCLLTQDTYLAVEAGLDVPEGLEMGPFSYFPDWSEEKARACRVLNRGMLEQLLRAAPASVAAFSDYGLAIRCPEIAAVPEAERAALWALVRERYEPAVEVRAFGQADTTLQIMVRRPAAR